MGNYKTILALLVLVSVITVISGLRIIKPSKYLCFQPRKVGPCDATIPRWYYNRWSKKCLQFIWGGCKANGNNFKTKEHCQLRCAKIRPVKNICLLNKDSGPCFARFIKYFYNSKTRKCEKFIYGGCKGNKNRFNTKRQCNRRCRHKDEY